MLFLHAVERTTIHLSHYTIYDQYYPIISGVLINLLNLATINKPARSAAVKRRYNPEWLSGISLCRSSGAEFDEIQGIQAIETIHLSVPAKLSHLADILQFIRASVTPFCSDDDFLYDLILAVEEAVTNIVLHGYQELSGNINIQVQTKHNSVEIILRDDAPAFDPTCAPAPRLNLPLADRPLGGLGIHLMRLHADRMTYRRTKAGQNELRLVKFYPPTQLSSHAELDHI